MLETPQRRWRIAFAPGPELMRRGADPLLLLRELRQMGVLEARAHIEDLPSLDEMDPVRCYARWEMTLTTAESADAIRDVFIFVEDACDLTIERAKDTAAEAAQLEPPALNSLPAPAAVARPTRAPEEKRSGAGRRATDKPETAASLRVPAARLDALVDLVGELVTVQARLSEVAARLEDVDVAAVSEEIERLTSALRENSMTMRMLPIRADLREISAAGARSGPRSGQGRGADYRGRGHRAGQDGSRSAGRSADAFDPQQHGSRD